MVGPGAPVVSGMTEGPRLVQPGQKKLSGRPNSCPPPPQCSVPARYREDRAKFSMVMPSGWTRNSGDKLKQEGLVPEKCCFYREDSQAVDALNSVSL